MKKDTEIGSSMFADDLCIFAQFIVVGIRIVFFLQTYLFFPVFILHVFHLPLIPIDSNRTEFCPSCV